MSITLHVSLLSGRRVTLETGLDVDVQEFKQRAQSALSVGRGRLLHPGGFALHEARTIRDCGWQTDDVLTLQLQPVMILASRDWNGAAFAAILGDGSIVAWGDADYGGDSSSVQDQLRNVLHVQASDQAFAAILADGSAVTWGNSLCGGNRSSVQDFCARSAETCAADSSL